MKKVLKWGAVILLVPILLFLLAAVLLYTPPVQNWAVKKVAAYASEKTGMDITVGHVALRFPLDLTIDSLRAIKDNDSIPGLRDTIADVGKLFVDIQLKPLLDKQVEIDALGFRQLKLNTNGFIDDLRVKGNVESLDVECHGVDLNKSLVNIDAARLDSARLEICLADTVPPDTTETPLDWKIKVADLQLSRADVTVRMPGDTMAVAAYVGDAKAVDADIDLKSNRYQLSNLNLAKTNVTTTLPGNKRAKTVIEEALAKEALVDLEGENYQLASLEWKGGTAEYHDDTQAPVSGLDASHLQVRDIHVKANTISYSPDGLVLDLDTCTLKEKSGLHVEQLKTALALDDKTLHLDNLYLKTPDSKVKAQVDMDLNTFDKRNPGKLDTSIDAYIGKQDLMRVMGGMPKDFVRKWPNQPLAIKGKAKGNMQRVDFKGLNVSLPTALQLHADGYVANVTNPDRLEADVNVKGTTSDLDFLTALLDKSVTDNVKIPNGISLDGNIKAKGHQYEADFVASEGGGEMKAALAYDTDRNKYSATIDTDRFPLQHFLPGMGLSPLTAHIEADGQGTDFMSPATKTRVKARIGKFHYGKYDLDGMTADATLSNGRLAADIDSHNPLLNGNISFDALMDSKRLQGTFACDLTEADLYRLHLIDKPFNFRGCAHLDIDTDFKQFYKVEGSLGDMALTYNNTLFRPDNIALNILTRSDTTYAHVSSGDFLLHMNGSGGYEAMLKKVERFSDELTRQMKDKHFDQETLRDKLPDANIYLESGSNNFFVNLAREEGLMFDQLLVDLEASHLNGLNGSVNVSKLVVDSIQLDSIAFNILTDSTGFKYTGQVKNLPDNPHYCFNAVFNGAILEKGADIQTKLFDKNDKLALNIGAVAAIEQQGVRVNLTDSHPVIGYMPFEANDDNYVFIGDDRRLSANLKLKSEDGMHIQLYTDDENQDALQDLTLSLGKVDLQKIISFLPFMPQIAGIADGDFHIVQTPENLSVSSSLSVKGLAYQGLPMGNLATEFVYMPNEDGSHHVDGVLFSEGEEVAQLVGTYNPEGEGYLDARLHADQLPLSLVNSFIPDQLIGFRGTAEGDLSVKGPLSSPDVNGELYLENTYIFSEPYGVSLQVADDPVRIVGSNLLFENFEIFDANRTPLNVSGKFDFSRLDNMHLDLRMRTQNFMIINAKETPKSEAFGKAFVNFFGVMRGPLDALSMRGRMDVLGSTDMTYVLKDSPLTADTRLDELVRFVDFNDSTEQVVTRPQLAGFNMDLTLEVDQGARIKCDLNPDHSNYIDLVGGGNLRMRYNAIDNLMLTGKYTLNEGEMKYSLPIIPLKTFTIQEGSYIEFRGEPMNPVLHITATETRKATVEGEEGVTRSVDFTCGVVISQTLNDMGLEFIVSAPDDVTINSELASMTTEERGKVAVTMLTTGMYLADGNTSGFTMNGALSSFLQNEINNITGNALRSLDLTIGVDNATDASGTMHTDYSFKFAKRFWNNRLRIVIGGKVSTGGGMENGNNSFFTNATAEYRLSPTSNKYLKVFYDRDSYDWLEGEIGEYGVGFLWRRKLQHFSDIFNFKNETTTFPSLRRDSTLRVRATAPADTINNETHEESSQP